MPVDTTSGGFMAINAESGEPIRLAMQQLWVQGKILPVGARLIVRHVFRSGENKPLEVIYAFAMPRDAALRQFVIAGDGFRVRSRLKATEEAVKEYEAGIQDGHLATLARQYRDGVVNLTVGNIRPQETVVVLLEVLAGVEARDGGLRFRFPFTLAPAYHRGARAVEFEPGVGEIELPEQEFDDVIPPRYHQDFEDLHEVGFSLSIAMARPLAEVSSPSHAVRVKLGGAEQNQAKPGGELQSRVTLATAHDVPDRDLVLDVTTRETKPSVLVGVGKDSKRRFAALVPSPAFGEASEAPRRVVFVLDRSGSMQGAAIEQARKALAACLGALAADDQFGIVAFDNQAETFASEMQKGDRSNRDAAGKFLAGIAARGGTELALAVAAAVKLLGHSTGDILVMTDGQVAGTEQILAGARAGGVRLHCLGIGSASQDRFLTLLARETGGVCRFVTPRERVDLAAVDLFASIGRPLASEMKAHLEGADGGHIAPDPPCAVFQGTPVVLFGEAGQPGESKLILTWEKPRTGRLELSLEAPDHGLGETLRLLQGSRLITDLDSRYLGETAGSALDRREQKRIGDRLQTLSETYGLASRRMSLVAVVERAGDKRGDIPKTTVVPVGMPQDVSFGAYFGGMRGVAGATALFATMAVPCAMPSPGQPAAMASAPPSMISPPPPSSVARPLAPASPPQAAGSVPLLSRISNSLRAKLSSGKSEVRHKIPPGAPAPVPPSASAPVLPQSLASTPGPEDMLMDLAQQLEPDGGMPGKDDYERAARSLAAVLAFLVEGHTPASGAFRTHVQRLTRFLETSAFPSLSTPRHRTLNDALAWIKKGAAPPWKLGDLLAWKDKEAWDRITKLVTAA